MSKNIFVRATALSNVSGRVAYITSLDAQENLAAFYSTINDSAYWSALSAQSQRQQLLNPGKPVCEARELVIALPNALASSGRYALCRAMVEDFHRTYGVECCAAIHANPDNYHMHLIFSERTLLPEIEASIATRNTYFNAEGKRSTKKECVDEDGNLLPQCRLVRKGESLSEKQFSAKDNKYGQRWWLMEEKKRLATFLNAYVEKEGVVSEPLKVYEKDRSVELPMTRLVRGEPEEVRVSKIALNAEKREYNENVHEAIEAGILSVPEAIEQKNDVLQMITPPHVEQLSTNVVVELLQRMRRVVHVAAERLRERLREFLEPMGVIGDVDALIRNALARSGTDAGRAEPKRGRESIEYTKD